MESTTPAEEAEALHRIGMGWRFVLRGIHSSPLESPCEGTSPFDAAVERLRGSALVWPSFDAQALNKSTAVRLDRIATATETALWYFVPVRTKSPPMLSGDAWAPVEPSGWGVEQCIPPFVHRWVKRTFFAMQSTSRPALDEDTQPSIAALCESGFYAPPSPLRDAHLAAVAALVCLARALYALDDVLSHWRWAVAQAAPALHFEGRAGSAEWEDAIYAARRDAGLRSYEAERLGDASNRIAQAEGWLGCAAQTIEADRAAQRAAYSARVSEREQQTKRRSEAARKTLDVPKATSTENRSAVERAARSIGETEPPAELTALVVKRTRLSRPTVRGHLRALGLIPNKLRK